MQTDGDRLEASYFYPAWGKWLDELEKAVKAKHGWGWGDNMPKKQKIITSPDEQFMCTGCKINYEEHAKD